MDKSFADIDALRARLGVAQAELCRRAEVSESTITRARGNGREPTRRILRRLDAALKAISEERGVVVIEEARDAAE